MAVKVALSNICTLLMEFLSNAERKQGEGSQHPKEPEPLGKSTESLTYKILPSSSPKLPHSRGAAEAGGGSLRCSEGVSRAQWESCWGQPAAAGATGGQWHSLPWCAVTPAPRTARVIAALCPGCQQGCWLLHQDTSFLNRGQMVDGAGHHSLSQPFHWEQQQSREEKSSRFEPFAACKGSLRQELEGCSAHRLAARLGSSSPTCYAAHASAGCGTTPAARARCFPKEHSS